MSPSPNSSSMMYTASSNHHHGSLLHLPQQEAAASSARSFRRTCSSPSDHSWASDWSDPRENNCNSRGNTASGNSGEEEQLQQEEAGVLVPALLQQLFGIDFLPSPVVVTATATTSTTPSQQRHLEPNVQDGDDDSPLAALSRPDLRMNGLAEQNDNDLYKSSKEQSESLFNGKGKCVDEPTTMEEQKARRRMKNKRLVTAIRKAFNNTKRMGTAKNINQVNQQSKTISGTATATTPRRKGSNTPRGLCESINQGIIVNDDTTTQWVREQVEVMQQQQSHLARVSTESQQVQERALSIQKNISSIQSEVSRLQQALQSCLSDLQEQVADLDTTKARLGCLEEEASRAADNVEQAAKALRKAGRGDKKRLFRQGNHRHRTFTVDSYPTIETFSVAESNTETKDSSVVPAEKDVSRSQYATTVPPPMQYNRRRASTEPPRRSSSSFMRVNDLELEKSVLSTHSSLQDLSAVPDTDGDFFFIDHDIPLVMEQLFKLGYDVVTDESDRFEPTRETRRLLQQRKQAAMQPIADWPIYPWHAVGDTDDIYVWTGGVPHRGFGHDWPVVKARTLIRASPRAVLDVLLDSSQIKKYNKMSQGREDVVILQEGVETTSEESQYGFAGDARIMRALNKPRLFPKTIEMLSLWYSQQLENAPGSYMTVCRSVWEDELGHGSKASNNNMLRSEMLLGVTLLRPCPFGCEITTITHVFSPGVPEVMAKRSTPGSAANLLRDIQCLFPKEKE